MKFFNILQTMPPILMHVSMYVCRAKTAEPINRCHLGEEVADSYRPK